MPKRTVSSVPNWSNGRAALRYIPPFLKLVWRTKPGYAIAMMLLRMARAFVPLSTLWIGKLIIDAVIAARSGGADLAYIWKLVALEILIVLSGEALARASAM